MGAAIRMAGVVKAFSGPGLRGLLGGGARRALDGLSFEVPAGSICAFVGPNGAGKTTTMSILSGYLTAEEGEVDLLGAGPFDPIRHRGRVGVLPQDAELPPASSPRQLLSIWAQLQGMSGAAVAREVDRALEAVLLRERAEEPVRSLSHGMRRRVTVASALLGEPELVLLDEPTSGLDPSQAAHLRGCLEGLRGRRTVLISSHNLMELERLCDFAVFIERGRCARSAPMRALTGADQRAVIALEAPIPAGLAAEVPVEIGAEETPGAAITRELARLIAAGARISEVRRGASLEQQYLHARSAEAGEGR